MGSAADKSSEGAGVPTLGPQHGEDSGSLDGTVTDDALAPLPQATVTIVQTGAKAETDETGHFALSYIAPGTYAIQVDKIGYRTVARSVSVEAGRTMSVSFSLLAMAGQEPYFVTHQLEGLIGCGILLRTSNDPNASDNLVAACGIFGNAGYYNIDRFVMDWTFGDLNSTSGAWMETTWTPSQAAGRSLAILYALFDNSNTAGGTYSLLRAAGRSPIQRPIPTSLILETLAKKNTFDNCTATDCTLHLYHYGKADTLGSSFPTDTGATLNQRYTEYCTMFYHQSLPERFTALPDA